MHAWFLQPPAQQHGSRNREIILPVRSSVLKISMAVNIHEYKTLCDMPFQHISSLTSQISALDGSDNFNYIMALQDICSRLESSKPKLFRLKRGKRKRLRRPKPRPPPKEEESGSWFNWDIFGLFTEEEEEKVDKESESEEFSFLDPFGLFSSDIATEKTDKNQYKRKYVYQYDYYYDDNDDYFYDYDHFGSQSEVVPSTATSNKRLAFVHYVYPKSSPFKAFEKRS